MLICDKELRDLWEIFATIPANPLVGLLSDLSTPSIA